MAASDSFLATCRALIASSPERTVFLAALDRLQKAGNTDEQAVAWAACYSDAQLNFSPAYRFKRAIRDIVLVNGTSLSDLDKEGAYRTLSGEAVQKLSGPSGDADDQASLFREVLKQMVN